MIEQFATEKAARAEKRRERWWVIGRNRDGRLQILTSRRNERYSMPVFGFRDEAEMFLWLDGLASAGWRVRESTAGELASVLCGVRACTRHHVDDLLIDPLPEAVDGGLLMNLVKVEREVFVGRLLAEKRQPGRIVPAGMGGIVATPATARSEPRG